MPDRDPIETTNLDRYGDDPLPWSRPHDLLSAGPPQPQFSFFLATTQSNGRPHVAGIGVTWHDGDLFFTCGPATRKARNLAVSSTCVIAVGLEGLDLVLEGDAAMVDDPELAKAVVAVFRESGWPAELEGSRIVGPYSAPTAGPPPWDIYRFRFQTAFGVATAEPSGGTRWRWDAAEIP